MMRDSVFTLIPLLIVMAVFLAVIIMADRSFGRSRKRRLSSEPPAVPFSSPEASAKWTKALLAACLALSVVAVVSGIMQLELLSRMARGYGFTMEEAARNDLRQRLVAVLRMLLYYGTAVPFLLWFHRIYRNLRSLGNKGLIFTPGWAVGFFFVPLFNLVRPFQAMREAWHGSDPARLELDFTSDGRDFGRRLGTPPLVGWWWALFIIPGIIATMGLMFLAAFMTSPSIPLLRANTVFSLAQNSLGIAAALAAIRLVGRLTRWQVGKLESIRQRGGLAAVASPDAPAPDDPGPPSEPSLSFQREASVNPYFAVLKRYVDFKGRAGRPEFWGFTLINAPIIFLLVMLDIAMYYGQSSSFPYLTLLYYLSVFFPSLGVLLRRLHDTGRSGWWCLIGLIPFAGEIVLLVFLAAGGEPGPNRYGSDPKDIGDEATIKIRPGAVLVAVTLLIAGVSIATSVYLPRFSETEQSVFYPTDNREEPPSFGDLEKIQAEAARMITGLEARVTRHSSEAGSYGAAVDVRNTGSKSYDWVMVKVEFCDKTGRVVGTLKNDARGGYPIPPGGMRTFTVSGPGKLAYETVRASVDYSVEVK